MQIKILRFAQELEHRPILRHVFYLAATMACITLVGYHFGTFDQVVHIPFLKTWANPALYPNDPFLDLRYAQYSYFWLFFLPFLRSGVLEPVVFGVHILSTYLFFWAIWDISLTLFDNALAAVFAVLSFIFPHIGFLGFPAIEFSLLGRTFVLPFVVFAINLYLHRRYGLAFLLLGLLYNVHLLTINFILAALIFTSLCEIRKVGWGKLASGIGLFLLGAAPVLLWKLQDGTGLDWSLRPEWLSAFTRGILFQIFYLFSLTPIVLLTLGGLSAFGLYWVAQRFMPASSHSRRMGLIMLALVGILVVEVITTQWLPVTFIIQMQISRASLFILIFSYVYFAGYLAKVLLSQEIAGGNFILVAGAFFFQTSPIAPMLSWIVQKRFPGWLLRRRFFSAGIILVSTGVLAGIMLISQCWQPGFYVFEPASAWVDVQNWARQNTPQEAVFITPPQEVGLYTPDWRTFSERGTVAELYDLSEIALKPDYLAVWQPRFEALAPGALERFNGNFFENQVIIRQAYNGLSASDFLSIACRYKAAYLVIERAAGLAEQNLPVVYENEQYRVYDLRPQANCQIN